MSVSDRDLSAPEKHPPAPPPRGDLPISFQRSAWECSRDVPRPFVFDLGGNMSKTARCLISFAICFMLARTASAEGNFITSDLWIRAVIHTVEKGGIEGVWKKGGEDTLGENRVIWGYFYASPDEISWGNPQNPDVFVKVWFDESGRTDVNFFHVSVPDIEVYSDYPYNGVPDRSGRATTSTRYIRHCYENGGSYGYENKEDGNPAQGYWAGAKPSGYHLMDDLKIAAVINTLEKGATEAIWCEGGRGMPEGKHKVIWGYFYADPNTVSWGSVSNPELFVKVWLDASGRIDVNFFHVSVPDIEVYSNFSNEVTSQYSDDIFYKQKGTTVTHKRYIRHEYAYWYASWADPDCSVQNQNEYLYETMKYAYLWNDKVPETDVSLYSSPDVLLEHIKYERDQWSYIASKEEYDLYTIGGNYFGLGLGVDYDVYDDCRITFVYKDSPAAQAGLKRNDRILEINGKTVQEIEAQDLWDSVFYKGRIGDAVDLKIQDSQYQTRRISVKKDLVEIQTILHYDVIEYEGLKVGYVVFNEFLSDALRELDAVFAYFSWKGIDELILDIRYNPGGSTSVAEYLGNLIAGDRLEGKIFAKYLYNDNYSDWNEIAYFKKPANKNALNLNRIVFITTGATASSSELLINGLKPFMDVILIGDTTSGKPVGYSFSWEFCDRIFLPIVFKSVNSRGEGDYFDGFSPACYAADDLSRTLGDTQETSLKAALHYLKYGNCPNISYRAEKSAKEKKRIKLHGFRGEIGAF